MNRVSLTALMLLLLGTPTLQLAAQDIFGFYAPPGGVYLNASYEQDNIVEARVTIEHQGAAIPDWFLTASAGGAGIFEPREATQGSFSIDYQIYGSNPPSTDILKEPPAVLTAANVITSADFGTFAGTQELVDFTIYVSVASGQFTAAGEYTDSVTLTLYTGDFATPGTHVVADTAEVAVTVRMAELVDIRAEREAGIRSMDLTTTTSDRLLANIFERSNSASGYTVTITSANLSADAGTATTPYFAHTEGGATLEYTLTYGGLGVAFSSAGSALVVDSSITPPLTTAPEEISRQLRISYFGSTDLSAGDYEDRLVLTIAAK